MNFDEVVNDAKCNSCNDRELAINLHNFVRDNIAFGFTPYFDHAEPEKTLAMGVGHCNPQANLMAKLFRGAGLKARFKPVTITNDVLRGVAVSPPKLSHIFTEVYLDKKWIRLDSYIVDKPLRQAAVKMLENESRELGYGCHVNSTGNWDGVNDSFSQIAGPHLIIEEHEPVEDIHDFYASKDYLHKLGPFSFSNMFAVGRLFNSASMSILNRKVQRLRKTKI